MDKRRNKGRGLCGGPLHKAITDRDLETLVKLLQTSQESKTSECFFDVIDINGTAANNAEGLGMSALHLASKEGLLEFVEAILAASNEDRRVKVNMTDVNGFCALHLAAQGGHAAVVRCLLAAGATVNGEPEGGCITVEQPKGHIWPNKTGDSPLHLAVTANKMEVVHILVEHGACIDKLNIALLNPLDIAAENNNLEAVSLFLEKQQWDPESLGKALHRACRYGAVGVLPELVKAGANVEWKTTNGTTPLMAAAQEGHKDAAEFMLSVTANINAVRSTDGASAIYLAVLGKKPDVVRLLVASGADRTLRRSDGTTALDLAQKRGFQDIIEILSGK